MILEGKPVPSFILFGLAVLSKHQALVFLPVILLLLMKRFSWKEILQSLTAFTATGLLFFIPFNWENPIGLGLRIYLGGYGQYNFASLNAFNLWALIGFDVNDNQAIFSFITYQVIGWIILISVIFLILYYIDTDSLSKPNNSLMIYLSSILYFAFFMFLTRIHERYLFPVIALNLLSLTYDKKAGGLYALLTATFIFNQAYALHFLNKRMFVPNGDPLAIAASLVNLAAFAFSLYILISKEGLKRKTRS